jgi:uncharacterized protein (DUF924 family)
LTAVATYRPEQVLDFWFPDTGHENDPEAHAAFWHERMQGGMDARIVAEFAGLAEAAAKGLLDHWAETPRGRLALLIAVDQFPRSLWRDTPAAFGQDIKATRLALDGIENGHFDALAPWEQTFFVIAISHCEGPDHLERMEGIDSVVERIVAKIPPELAAMRERLPAQHEKVKGIIARFGRHPHRNPIYGRVSSPDEEAYIAEGDFPHVAAKPAT